MRRRSTLRAPNSKDYRLDVQGLRGVAVIAVILYHSNEIVNGGFVGVDIFFVISGFVISSLLMREYMLSGAIDFMNFYKKRYKRLAPALIFVIVFTLSFGFVFLTNIEKFIVAKTAMANLVVSSNIYIAITTSDYFDNPAEKNPLLHTWSLSVEEQFYLVFPLLIYVVWRLLRKFQLRVKYSAILIAFLSVLSFLSMLLSNNVNFYGDSYILGFYSPVVRFWEFGAGAIIGILSLKRIYFSQLIGILGFVLILCSIFFIDKGMIYPSWITIFPVLGATFVILSGVSRAGSVYSFLSNRFILFLGAISYSLYLWHWPIIVFIKNVFPDRNDALYFSVILSLVPAYLSYRFIENPIRNSRSINRKKLLFMITFFSLIVLSISTLLIQFANEEKQNSVNTRVMLYSGEIGHDQFHIRLDRSFYPCLPIELRKQAPRWKQYVQCKQSKSGVIADIALLGDSHSEHLFPGLATLIPNKIIVYYDTFGVPISDTPAKKKIIDYVLSSKSIKTVILNAYWKNDGRTFIASELAATMQQLISAGKRVYITSDVPSYSFDPYFCKYDTDFMQNRCGESASRLMKDKQIYFQKLKQAVNRVPQVRILDTFSAFCSETSCSMTRGVDILYRDANHLNIQGSLFVAHWILRQAPELAAAA
jgi:peptidoglycan/LPS O-acetylase OafA/YrhL